MTLKSRPPFGAFVILIINLLSYLNYASLYIAGNFYRGPGRNVVLGACLSDLHWGLKATLALSSTILLFTQLQSLILANRSRAWNLTFATQLFAIIGGLWVWDICAAYGVSLFNISTIHQWLGYHVTIGGFVISFLFINTIICHLFEAHLEKSSNYMYRYPLWSYLMDRTALQYGRVPVTNTHRTLSFLGAMLRIPSLLWSLFSFFVFLFRSKLSDSFGTFAAYVAVSFFAAWLSPTILVKGLRKLGDVDYEAKANAREKDHGLEDGLF